MKLFKTLDDVDVKNKTVILRVDINVPYDVKKRKIIISDRLIEHSKTIKELSDKKAKVVILAHQGRKGDPDFIHLNQHAKVLSKLIGKKIEFVNDIIGKIAIQKIESLKPGEIILLDNVRFLPDETKELPPEKHAKSKIVKSLAHLADIFVNDAFSTAHRSHASLVGFTKVLPSYAGRVMEKEVLSEQKALNPKGINTFILGGAKITDDLSIMEHLFKKSPRTIGFVLTCGLLGNICLLAKGYDIGNASKEFLKKKKLLKLLPEVKKLLKNYKDKILTPVDFAVEIKSKRKEFGVENLPINLQILDIGKKTVKMYAEIIKKSNTIVVKGPAGMYEKKGFEKGTKWLLEEVKKSKAYSLIGGGDTLTALKKLKFKKEDFSHISLGGGALITFLSGKPMPAIEALKN